MQESKLKSIAFAVRQKIEQVIDELPYVDVELQNFPSGSCEVASVILGLYVQSEHGIDVVQSVGKRPILNDYRENNHVWLTVNDSLIIDITADQFEDFQEQVFVGSESAFHSTFEVYETRPIDFSYLNRRGSVGYGGVYKIVSTSLAST
ncbi:hypothetical protein [Marinomonas sp.]|uniref:hypothetical protein n=1 Tax=Marinomonas sp. TaxID=1904862 RepID=UPI003BACDD2B